MAKKIRNLANASFFHVLVQGINKEFIFDSYDDMKKYKKLLFPTKDEYDLKIVAYCIMHNHAHILINTDSVSNLSAFMHKINTKFALYYNSKYERVGYVFRSRFKSEEIYTKEYLYNCINYIHKNPVKAGLCKNEEDYLFSSYKEFQKKKKLFEVLPNCEKVFIDTLSDMDDMYEELIKKYFENYFLTEGDLLKNKEKLKELVDILNAKNKMSYSEIGRRLNIGRETIRKVAIRGGP